MDGIFATTPQQLEEITASIRDAGKFVFDLEFVPEGRYVPELGLVQVAWGNDQEPKLAAIDPLEVDIRPFVELVADEQTESIVHAAQADLALLAGHYDIRGTSLYDTQIAAAFIGYGDQIGYAALVERMLGIRLRKGSQYTEWLRRPLSEQQIAYAFDDVRYLGRVWTELQDQLNANSRLPWVVQECELLAATAWRRPPPEESYLKVKGWSGLNRRSRGALRALAAWREREALRSNRPTSRILNDRSLLELARTVPTSTEDLSDVRGIDVGIIRRYGATLINMVEDGAGDPPERQPARTPLSPAGDVWAATLHGLVRAHALAAEIAPRFVGPRREIEAVVRWWLEGDRATPPALPLLQGWRGELVGQAILSWLNGHSALIVDPTSETGIKLEPR